MKKRLWIILLILGMGITGSAKYAAAAPENEYRSAGEVSFFTDNDPPLSAISGKNLENAQIQDPAKKGYLPQLGETRSLICSLSGILIILIALLILLKKNEKKKEGNE